MTKLKRLVLWWRTKRILWALISQDAFETNTPNEWALSKETTLPYFDPRTDITIRTRGFRVNITGTLTIKTGKEIQL
jgi:hypothetical protein